MRLFVKVQSFLRNLFASGSVNVDLDREIHSHLEMLLEENIRAGMPPEQAQRAARMELGGIEQLKEQVRDQRIGNWLHSVFADCRYGVRQLRKNRGFTAVAVFTLALGIGANTTIFSVVWRPMRYSGADRLLMVWETRPDRSRSAVSARTYLDWRDQSTSFEHLAAARSDSVAISGKPSILVAGAHITQNFFDTFRLRPELGRFFSADELRPNGERVVVLSHEVWQTHFGGDPAIVGKTARLNGEPYRVIGVAPADFEFFERVDVWLPLALPAGESDRQARDLLVVGRMKPGLSAAQAAEEMRVLAERVAQHSPETNRQWSALCQDFYEALAGPGVQLMLILLFVTVSVVLLMACANVANLLLARGTARQKEIAVRIALGASRNRILRQLLSETLLLALLGGALGLLLAFAAVRYLATLSVLQAPGLAPIQINRTVLAFAAVLSLVTTVLSGLVPAWQTSAANPLEQVKASGSTYVGDRRHSRLRSGLVTTGLALSLVLMVTAGLSLRSSIRLAQADPGFRSEELLTAHLSLPDSEYANPTRVQNFYSELLRRVRAIPGVEDTAICSELPPSDFETNQPFRIEGSDSTPAVASAVANYQVISASYFRTLGLTMRKGRELSADDRQGRTGVVVVNQRFAEKFFPGSEPLGKRLLISQQVAPGDEPRGTSALEIVGIVNDLKSSGLDEPSHPQIYASYLQAPEPGEYLVVRSGVGSQALVDSVHEAVRSIDPDLPLTDISTMDERRARAFVGGRVVVSLMIVFAFIALSMGAAGLYGVISYSVSQRTTEFALRLALGAPHHEIFRLIATDAFRLLVIGGSIGMALALGVTRILGSMIVGVSPHDPLTLVTVALVLLVVVLTASYLPARRAMKADPMVALRYE